MHFSFLPHNPVRKDATVNVTDWETAHGVTCPRSDSEWEASGMWAQAIWPQGHDHCSIFPRLPSDLLWEILRQTGAVGFVEGIFHGSTGKTQRQKTDVLGGQDTWRSASRHTEPFLLGEGQHLCEVQREVVIVHLPVVQASFISSVSLWIDSSAGLGFHHENASASRAAVSPCWLEVKFHGYRYWHPKDD